ncbi:MAG: sigma-70 family RNA polymerase sigma factor [Candidatus Aminicenantales bacterium]
MEEKELIRAALAGEERAFSLLVKKYEYKVLRMVLSFTRKPQVADDLAQEIFIKAYFGLSKFRHKSEFSTWLYRIAVNHIKDYLRKKERQKEVSLNSVREPISVPEDKYLSEEKEKEQKIAQLYRLINELPEKLKIVLNLRDIQGLSYREISKILRVSIGTVDSRLFRARKMLLEKYNTYLKEKGGKDGM